MRRGVPRVIFDCNVLLQALLHEGPAFRCLERVESEQIELLVSPATLEEAREVFARPALIRKFPQLTPERVSAFLNLLVRKATLLEDVPHVADLPRDSKDEPYLDLAAAGRAAYLVTRDKDLLSLPQERSPEADAIRRLCPDLRIMDPQAFLREHESPASSDAPGSG